MGGVKVENSQGEGRNSIGDGIVLHLHFLCHGGDQSGIHNRVHHVLVRAGEGGDGDLVDGSSNVLDIDGDSGFSVIQVHNSEGDSLGLLIVGGEGSQTNGVAQLALLGLGVLS